MTKVDFSLQQDGAKARYRARLRILSDITSFALTHSYPPNPQRFGSLRAFFPGDYGRSLIPGDLVVLESAPASKWYLSWYVEKDAAKDIYVLESIEDGQLCNWTNVGLSYYDREVVARCPEWRWLDKQFEFNDRWRKAAHRTGETTSFTPLNVAFDGEDVSFSIRTRWNFGEKPEPAPIFVPNWKKIKMKQLTEVFLKLVAEAELRDKK